MGSPAIGGSVGDLASLQASYFHSLDPSTVQVVASPATRSEPLPALSAGKMRSDEPIALRKNQPTKRWRVALYSHDTMGLGHFRRNQLIAQAIASSDLPVNVLLIAGIREAGAFALPPGVDLLTLPALHKTSDGTYESRHLNVNLADIVNLRAQTIAAALTAFAPDVFIVDNVPRGAVRELDLTLRSLTKTGRTRLAL